VDWVRTDPGLRGPLQVDGPFALIITLTSTAGLALLSLALCLRHARSTRAKRWLLPAAIAGSMPLTAYVGHALLFSRTAEVWSVALPDRPQVGRPLAATARHRLDHRGSRDGQPLSDPRPRRLSAATLRINASPPK
jgi:hypothetical protein